MNKKEVLYIISVSLLIIGLVLALLFHSKKENRSDIEILLKEKNRLLQLKNEQQSEKFKFTTDSMQIYYSGMDKANQRTNNSINKILKQNEKNKADLHIITDSTKYFIADSLLRSGGYR